MKTNLTEMIVNGTPEWVLYLGCVPSMGCEIIRRVGFDGEYLINADYGNIIDLRPEQDCDKYYHRKIISTHRGSRSNSAYKQRCRIKKMCAPSWPEKKISELCERRYEYVRCYQDHVLGIK